MDYNNYNNNSNSGGFSGDGSYQAPDYSAPTQNTYSPQNDYTTTANSMPQNDYTTTANSMPQNEYATTGTGMPQNGFSTTGNGMPQNGFGTTGNSMPQNAFGTTGNSMPQNDFSTAGTYTTTGGSYMAGNQMPFYGAPEPTKRTSGLGIASLVLGILSMTICCCGGSLLGLIGFILGIVAVCKKNTTKGVAIGGIITSVLGMIIGVVMLVFIATAEDYTNPFASGKFEADDSSTIYFELDTFEWYYDDMDHSDNYYKGDYTVYSAEDAEDYFNRSVLPYYDYTRSEIDEYVNADGSYSAEEFYILVLDLEEVMLDGEHYYGDEFYDTVFVGYYTDGYFEAVDVVDDGLWWFNKLY